jgi:hypothetical protein
MNTVTFFMAIYNWLLADPSHLVAAASAIAAFTPTPNPTTPAGKVYKVLELFALNFLHAKDSGLSQTQALAQVAAILEAQKTAPAKTE